MDPNRPVTPTDPDLPTTPNVTLDDPPSASPANPKRGAITFRSILLGLLLMPPNAYWCLKVEGIWHTGHPSALSLFWNVIFTILVLIVVNLGIKRVSPRHALSQGELIVIYILLYMMTALAGHDSLQLQIPSLSLAWYGATDANKYADFVQPYLPEWLTVQNEDVITPFFEGHSSLFMDDHWRFWVMPIFWWTLFIAALGLVLICFNVFLRRQWTEHEKLSYPIIQLPLAMTEKGGDKRFFSSKLFWIGFFAAASLDVLNGLSRGFVPATPYIPIRHEHLNLRTFMTEAPWTSIDRLEVPKYPFLVALGFFLPLDLSFSIWFFYLFQKFQMVLAGMINLPGMPELPYTHEQSGGALFVICLYTLWLARRHLSGVFRTIFGLKGKLDDSQEPVSYRMAALGVVAGCAFLYWFCRKAGMTPGFIVAFFILYFIIALAITRIRAELGPPAHEMVHVNAHRFIISAQGTEAIAPRDLGMYALFYWFTGRGYRTQIMPPMMEGFKMAERAGMNARGLGGVMLLGLYVGGIAVYIIGINLMYTNDSSFNGMTAHNWGQNNNVAAWIEGLRPYDLLTNWPRLGATAAAMLFTAFLMFMRINSLKFPFHPAGYALSMTFGVDYFWSCLLVAWAIKAAVLKWGGYALYRKCLPICFGVLLGEYVVGATWSILSLILQRPIYDFSPG